jgi:hypothetical protein
MPVSTINSLGPNQEVAVSGDAVILPTGTTAERPGSAVPGMIRFNTSLNGLEIVSTASSWVSYSVRDGGSQATAATSGAQIVASGRPSGVYWISDGVETFQNYVLINGSQAWARVGYLTSNHQLVTGTRDRSQWMRDGGSYANGTVNAFSSTLKLDEATRGYWGHNALYTFSSRLGNTSPRFKVLGTNHSGQSVNKDYQVANYVFSVGANGNFDGNLVGFPGSVANFTSLGQGKDRGNWGSTGVVIPGGGHWGIGIREGGATTTEAGGPGALQLWHYSDHSQFVNVSFSNDGGTQIGTYNFLTTTINWQFYMAF